MPSAILSAAPASRTTTGAPEGSKAAKWAVAAIGLVVTLLIGSLKYGAHGWVALFSAWSPFGSGIDGSYASGVYPRRATITINGSVGSIDLEGIAHGDAMVVRREGDTVSISGGFFRDAENKPITGDARLALTGGSDVDVFKVGNGGQTLTLDDGDAHPLVFSKYR